MHKIVLAVCFAFSLLGAACAPVAGGSDEQMLAASADGYAAVYEVEPADGQPERPIVVRAGGDQPDAVGMCRSGTSARITTECQLFEQDSPWRCTCKQGQTVLGHCEQPGGVAIDACQRTCCD